MTILRTSLIAFFLLGSVPAAAGELLPPPPGHEFQLAYIPIVMAAVPNQTGAVKRIAAESIEVGEELTWTIQIAQFNGDPIKFRHDGVNVGPTVTEAGTYIFTHTATSTSPDLIIFAGTNPGGGARHVIGRWSVTTP